MPVYEKNHVNLIKDLLSEILVAVVAVAIPSRIPIREAENTLYWRQRVRRRDRSLGSLKNRPAAFFSRLAHLADQHSGPFRIDPESIIGSSFLFEEFCCE